MSDTFGRSAVQGALALVLAHQFFLEVISEDPQLKKARLERFEAKRREARQEAARQEAARQEAEQREAEQKALDAANMDSSRCKPAVSADCELLMQRLRYLQGAFLRTDPPSRLEPLRELSTVGQKIQAAQTRLELQEAAAALDSWQQRRLPK